MPPGKSSRENNERPCVSIARPEKLSVNQEPVSVQRIWAEHRLEEGHQIVCQLEVWRHALDVTGERDVHDRNVAHNPAVENGVVTRQHLDEIGRHRLALLPHPRIPIRHRPLLDELAVRHCSNARRHGQLNRQVALSDGWSLLGSHEWAPSGSLRTYDPVGVANHPTLSPTGDSKLPAPSV